MTVRKSNRRSKAKNIDAENASIYPMLSDAVKQVEARLGQASESSKPILEKWVVSLKQMDKEMRHLERIEKYTGALKKLSDDNN